MKQSLKLTGRDDVGNEAATLTIDIDDIVAIQRAALDQRKGDCAIWKIHLKSGAVIDWFIPKGYKEKEVEYYDEACMHWLGMPDETQNDGNEE